MTIGSPGPSALAQPGDVDLQRLGGRRRRILAPQHVDQPLGRHRLLAVREQQRRQQRALLGRPSSIGPSGPTTRSGPRIANSIALPARYRAVTARAEWRRAYRDKPSAGHTRTHRQGGAPCPCVATRGQPSCVASGPCGGGAALALVLRGSPAGRPGRRRRLHRADAARLRAHRLGVGGDRGHARRPLPSMLLGPLLGGLVDRTSRLGCAIAATSARRRASRPDVLPRHRRRCSRSRSCSGVGNALFRPATAALLPSLVADERLTAANALYGMVRDARAAARAGLRGRAPAARRARARARRSTPSPSRSPPACCCACAATSARSPPSRPSRRRSRRSPASGPSCATRWSGR